MTTYYTRFSLVLIGLLFINISLGQESFTGYFEPDISLNYKVSNNYSHNFELAKRSYVYEDDLGFRVRQLDLSHFSKLKIAYNKSIALGVQYRFRNTFENNEENELRFTQQYNITTQKGNIRLGNRFRTEQRITPSVTIHRFRYRFAMDAPLSGEKLDVGEAYIVGSTESLLSIGKASLPEYDQRFTAHLGWLLNKSTKLQTGVEYRLENYTHQTEQVLFILTSLVFSI